jgi:oxalate decarboxylase/phosphoglucose isomerase-like protein (cupin superfamily)
MSIEKDLKERFAQEKNTPYSDWVKGQGLDIIQGHYIQDLRTVELKPWLRRGGFGVYINHDASRSTNDCYVCEIPPAKSLVPQKQMYEEMFYVLSGVGSTKIWTKSGKSLTFEWKAGGLFAIPLNTTYQLFSGSGRQASRLLAVTNAPAMINQFKNMDFIFNNDYEFTDRFDGEPDYFAQMAETKGLTLETNYVSDTKSIPLLDAKERGAGSSQIRFDLAKGSMTSHISQFPVGTYKKAHYHGPGAHVIILSGEGYSLMWPEGGQIRQYDWQEGSMIIPPDRWWHQHFNTGNTPARYLALKPFGLSQRTKDGVSKGWISKRIGGNQIDYADETDAVRRTFEEALKQSGAVNRMDPIYEKELETLPDLKKVEADKVEIVAKA